MGLTKAIVAQNFDRYAHSYDKHASLQANIADYVAHLIKSRFARAQIAHIFDLGCGTGRLTDLIIKDVDTSYTLVDMSAKMLDIAKKNLKNFDKIDYLCVDIEKLDMSAIKGRSMVASSMCLQWLVDIRGFLGRLYRHFDFGMIAVPNDSSFSYIKSFCSERGLPYYFLDMPKNSDMELVDSKISIDNIDFSQEFSDMRAFLQNIKKTGTGLSHDRYSFGQLKAFLQQREPFLLNYSVSILTWDKTRA